MCSEGIVGEVVGRYVWDLEGSGWVVGLRRKKCRQHVGDGLGSPGLGSFRAFPLFLDKSSSPLQFHNINPH